MGSTISKAKERVSRAAGSKFPALALFCTLSIPLLGSSSAVMAGANLEEKQKYEQAIEQKVEDVLGNLLGPCKARVMIRAAVDFSSKENIEKLGAIESAQPQAEKTEEPLFKWQNINKQASAAELLPGFPADLKEPAPEARPAPPPAVKAANARTQRETIFPQSMIKRLTVSLVLSEDLSSGEAQKARQVVSDLLALDPSRGDEILVLRARFVPVWYTYEALLSLAKYCILAVIAVFGIGALCLCFLKVASAIRARDGPEPFRLSMETDGGPPALLPQGEAGDPAESSGGCAPPAQEPADGIIFNVKADKLEILVRMLAKDEPADIAIIAVHLPPALRGKFISMLPPETASEVLASVVKVRFVEPELIAKIKDGLESRLEGAVGGYEQALEMIEKVGIRPKEALLRAMEMSHPDVAARVRSRILLPDDLENLEDKDFAILAEAVSPELWASAAALITGKSRARLKKHLKKAAWKEFELALAGNQRPDERTDAAAQKILAVTLRLIGRGLIRKPGPAGAAIGFTPAGAAPGG